jgi:putative transposase
MDALHEFIRTTRDGRELKRALAVKMRLEGYSRPETAAVLGVSKPFVDKWRRHYRREGVAGLSLKYQGSRGYLTPAQHAETLAWIQAQAQWSVAALHAHVLATYGVQYKSRQSYYALLNEAHISWKKTQARHPKRDPEAVAETRTRIKKNH